MAEVGGGETRQRSLPEPANHHQARKRLPSSGESTLRPSPPRAVCPAPFLTRQGYRPYAAAPPQPVTARQRTSRKCLFIKKSNRNYMLLINSYVIRILQDFLLIGLLCPIQYYLRSEESPRGLWLFPVLRTSKPHLQS